MIKSIAASAIEFGNDEVYYWTYALFPDWSHFDHPPMVGFVIQLFSLNLLLQSEFFIRLGSLVLSSASIWLLFYLVKRIYSSRAAYIAVLLFTASIYFNIICGLFILPDTPLIFFILLALYFGFPAVQSVNPSRKDRSGMILFGVFTGFALLSKYTAVFTWVGIILFILIKNRIWLKQRSFYISLFLSLLLMIPVIYWNVSNHFISFAFHASRVTLHHNFFHNSSFPQFNLGQFFYQNPILFVLFILSLISLFKKRVNAISNIDFLLLCLSFPLISISILLSVFTNVLPHWSGPAFIGLLILCSEWLSNLFELHSKRVRTLLLSANLFILIIVISVFLQIDFGLFYNSPEEKTMTQTGEHDLSLDMYGWDQVRTKFDQFLKKEGIRESDYKNVKIFSNKWFPAAHLDYYVAYPLHIDLLVPAKLWDAHKYYWINQKRRLSATDKMFYITSSLDFHDPHELLIKFSTIVPRDTLRIFRNGKNVKNLFIYEMENPATELTSTSNPSN